MKSIHLPNSLTEYVVHQLASNSEKGALPFAEIRTRAKGAGMSPFKATALTLLDGYRQTLETKTTAIQEATEKTKQEALAVRNTILGMTEKTPEEQRQALKTDIEEHQMLMSKLVEDEQEEIAFVKSMSDQIKKESTLAKQNRLAEELTKVLTDLIDTLVKHQVSQVRKLNHYRTSMVNPDALLPAQVAERAEARAKVLKNKLQILEENLATYASAELKIKNELTEITEIIGILDVG